MSPGFALLCRSRQAQSHARQNLRNLSLEALGVRLITGDHDHEVVRVTDEPIGGLTVAATPSPVDPVGHLALPDLGEVLIED